MVPPQHRKKLFHVCEGSPQNWTTYNATLSLTGSATRELTSEKPDDGAFVAEPVAICNNTVFKICTHLNSKGGKKEFFHV
jgi:hypothetical protein